MSSRADQVGRLTDARVGSLTDARVGRLTHTRVGRLTDARVGRLTDTRVQEFGGPGAGAMASSYSDGRIDRHSGGLFAGERAAKRASDQVALHAQPFLQ